MEREKFDKVYDYDLGGYPALDGSDEVLVFGLNRRPYVTTKAEAMARVKKKQNAEKDKKKLENEKKDPKITLDDKEEIDKEISKKEEVIEENKSEEDPELDKARGDLKKINDKLDVIETTDEEYDYLVERKQELEEQLGINSFSNQSQEELDNVAKSEISDEEIIMDEEDMNDARREIKQYLEDVNNNDSEFKSKEELYEHMNKYWYEIDKDKFDEIYDEEESKLKEKTLLEKEIDKARDKILEKYPNISVRGLSNKLTNYVYDEMGVFNDNIQKYIDETTGYDLEADNERKASDVLNGLEENKLYEETMKEYEKFDKRRNNSISKASDNIRKLNFEFDDRTGDLMFNSKEDIEKAGQYIADSMNEIYGEDYGADFKSRIQYNEQGDNDYIEIYDANEAIGSTDHQYDDFAERLKSYFGEEGSDIFVEPYNSVVVTMAGFYGKHVDYPPEDDNSKLNQGKKEFNEKEVSQGILDRFGKDYGYDGDNNLENLKGQIDYMRNPGESLHRTAQRLVEGGEFLVYNGDIKTWLDGYGIEYNEDNFFDKYVDVMSDQVEKLYRKSEYSNINNLLKKEDVDIDLGNNYELRKYDSGTLQISSHHPYDLSDYSFAQWNNNEQGFKVYDSHGRLVKTVKTVDDALDEMKKIDRTIESNIDTRT